MSKILGMAWHLWDTEPTWKGSVTVALTGTIVVLFSQVGPQHSQTAPTAGIQGSAGPAHYSPPNPSQQGTGVSTPAPAGAGAGSPPLAVDRTIKPSSSLDVFDTKKGKEPDFATAPPTK